jgi:cytochrome c-type biogenesis protein
MDHLILHSPLPLAFVVAFAAGALSFLSPCVLPLVPGYLSMMSGVAAGELADGTLKTRTDQRRLLGSTLLFVGGFTVVFVILGAAATAVSRTLLEHQRTLNQVAGVVVILMGLVLAGFVSPAFMQRERRFHVSPSRLGVFAAPVMGMAFAVGWTPCIGPALSAVLLLAGAQGTLARGIAMLLAYSLGLGLPFVLSGLAFARLTGVFGWVKRHFRVIDLVSGLALVAFGLVLLTNNVHVMSAWFGDVLRAVHLDRLTYS